jgi:hypothetical protein
MTVPDIKRPELTMPEAEADWLRQAYEGASVILEYGSGGSTVMASELAGKTITSVESDGKWLRMMNGWFEANPAQSTPRLHHGKIGKTGSWGMPSSLLQYARFPNYSLGVWGEPWFEQPDVVLIDGRFRQACLLATLYRATRPVTVYFDDFVNRQPSYSTILKYAEPVEVRGRMARFELTPQIINPANLAEIFTLFGNPK